MIAKLSPAQMKALASMEGGRVLHAVAHMHPFLSDFQVYSATWHSLLLKGFIKREDQEGCPDYRRDYIITDQGVEALRQAGVPKQLSLEEPK